MKYLARLKCVAELKYLSSVAEEHFLSAAAPPFMPLVLGK